MKLEDLKDIVIDDNEKPTIDKASLRQYSKSIAITLGYLLGVRENFLELIGEEPQEYYKIKEKVEQNESAKAIRALNNIRSNLMLLFKKVSRTIRITSSEYMPLYRMPEFEEDFKTLSRLDINIITGRPDINEYLSDINAEIRSRIDFVKPLFPEWVNFKHIKFMFNMPSVDKEEINKFQVNQNYYPYRRYFYWREPYDCGNMLSADIKVLDVIYDNCGEYFGDSSKVMDASDNVKNKINEFINFGNKIQIFIDGENVDPYKFASAIDSLKDHEIKKIDKIVVYYDNLFSNKSWSMLKHFTYGIEVELVGVDRIKQDKSLVDHKLVAGVSRAVFRDGVDSVIIASSDSDFWSVIEDVKEAKYLVMVESEKCGHDFKEVLRRHDVFYCYLDKFMTPEDDMFFKTVFRQELIASISEMFKFANANELFDLAMLKSRAEISRAEKEAVFNKYVKGLTLSIDKNGNFCVVVPE